MSNWVRGVDISYAELTEEKANLLKLADVKLIFQCLWTGREQPGNRVTNLRNAHNAGIAIAGYASVNSTPGSGQWHMDQGRAGVPSDLWDALRRVAVDVELPGIGEDNVRKAVDRVASFGKGKLIYTSYHAWVDYLGNPLTFIDCRLWNANWDENPDIDFPHLPFGDWEFEDVVGEQWSGGTNLQGVLVDRDQFRDDYFGLSEPDAPPAPKPPPPPTDAQYLHAIETWAKITDEFAIRNHKLTGKKELRDQAKFLLGL